MSSSKIILMTKNRKKSGLIPIYLRVMIENTKKEYPLHLDVLESHWDSSKSNFKRAAPGSHQKNMIILKLANKADSIFLDYEFKGIKITQRLFEKEFLQSDSIILKEEKIVYFQPVGNEIVDSYVGKYSNESIRHFRAALTKINKFRENATIGEMDYKFFVDYEHYMRNVLKNGSNTVHKSIYYFYNMLCSAVKLNYIDTNPLENYKVKEVPTEEREFLSIEEVKLLEKLFDSNLNHKLKNTLVAFLFACYTSFRYSDIKELTKDNIEGDEIKLKQQKTKGFVAVPLSSQAKTILSYCNDASLPYLFKVYSNQKMNEYLKILAMMAGIEKNLSFHVARHTFATISLNLGIRIEVVSNLLGHHNIKTTAIYAKLLDKTKHEEMKKWEGI